MKEEKILHDEALDEDSEWAFWFDGKNINEVLFCQHFLQLHPMKCVRGRLFTVDGVVEDESEISQMILDEVRGCLTNGVAKAVSNLLASLKNRSHPCSKRHVFLERHIHRRQDLLQQPLESGI